MDRSGDAGDELWSVSTPPPKAIIQRYMGLDDDDDVKKRNDFNDDVDVNDDEDDDNDNEYDMTGLPRPFVICGPEGYRKDVLMKMLIKDLGAQIFGTVL